MQIPIITNESLAQMTLMQLTSYSLQLLATALPHVENIETAESNATAAAEAAAESEKVAADAAANVVAMEGVVTTAVENGVKSINDKTTEGLAQINDAITTVLNTEV